jgi:hypothetical protein
MCQEVAPLTGDQYEHHLQLTEEREVVPNLALIGQQFGHGLALGKRIVLQLHQNDLAHAPVEEYEIRPQDFTDAARYARIIRYDFELIERSERLVSGENCPLALNAIDGQNGDNAILALRLRRLSN